MKKPTYKSNKFLLMLYKRYEQNYPICPFLSPFSIRFFRHSYRYVPSVQKDRFPHNSFMLWWSQRDNELGVQGSVNDVPLRHSLATILMEQSSMRKLCQNHVEREVHLCHSHRSVWGHQFGLQSFWHVKGSFLWSFWWYRYRERNNDCKLLNRSFKVLSRKQKRSNRRISIPVAKSNPRVNTAIRTAIKSERRGLIPVLKPTLDKRSKHFRAKAEFLTFQQWRRGALTPCIIVKPRLSKPVVGQRIKSMGTKYRSRYNLMGRVFVRQAERDQWESRRLIIFGL